MESLNRGACSKQQAGMAAGAEYGECPMPGGAGVICWRCRHQMRGHIRSLEDERVLAVEYFGESNA